MKIENASAIKKDLDVCSLIVAAKMLVKKMIVLGFDKSVMNPFLKHTNSEIFFTFPNLKCS